MYMANNQVVIEDLYDDNTQPPEEDIIEYAEYIGINTKEEPELMWIAKQGVKAPLPRGWKAIHDLEQNELYYFNFDTGESIWDHPCDNDFKELVIEQRKILSEKGRENYKPPANFDMTQRQSSPTRQLKSGGETLKSTSSTTSGLIGGNNNQSDRLRNTSTHSILQRPELALYDTREIDFDEVNRINFNHDDEAEQQQQQQQVNHRQEDDESASWNNKNDDEESSEDSGGFQKPVDFGIDKETSAKLSKLDVKMMVGGEPTKENNNAESAPTTSREHLDSPTRNHIKNVLGNKYDKDENNLEIDLRKSLTDDKSYDLNTSTANNPKDFQNNLVLFQQSLEREFDQKRLELLEEKDNRIKRLKEDIDREMSRLQENERKRLLKDHEDKLNEIKRRNERELEYESEQLRRIHTEKLNQINAEFDREKQSRKEKFMTQIAKYISSGNKSGEEDMEESEEKEIGMYFDFIEKKYGQKLDDRKREIQLRYEKKLKDLDDELKQLFEKESDKKENEIRLMKEKNMLIENYDNELEKLMNERLKDFKEKEADQMNRIKEDYEIKVKAYREKYKQLEENEFNYLENEYNKIKDKMHDDYNTKITNLEMKLKSKQGLIDKQEDNLRKRMDIIQERRRNFDAEWTKLNEEERKLSEKRESLMEKSAQAVAADHYHSSKGEDDALKYKYEIEKLKLEKADLEGRLASMQRLIEKINDNLNSESRLASKELNRLDHSLEDSSVADSDKFMAKVNSVNSKLGRDFMEDEEEDSPPLPAPPVGGGDGSRRVYEDIAEEEEEEEEEEGEGGNAADKTDVIDDEEIGTAAAAQANENRGEPNEEDEDDELEEEEDDEDIKELVKQAKLKLRLKYYEARKRAQIEVAASTTPTNNVSASSAAAVVAAAQPLSHLSSISSESTDEDENENVIINNSGYQHHHHHHYQPPLPLSQEVNDTKRVLMDDLSREKDALHEANILLEKYKHSLIKRKLKLECDQDELRNDELAVTKINNSSALASKQTTSEKLKQQYLLEERKLMLEKEALELEQLGLNIKTAKRLMKQKKVQLKLLENGIKDPNNIMLSNKKSSSNNAIELVNKQEAPSNDEENNDENDYSDQLDQDTITNSRADSNLETSSQRQAAQTTPKGPITGLSNSFSSLIYRLKFNNNENTTSSPNINLTAMTGSTNGMEKLTPILKKLPKLNHRLHITFENMKSTPTQLADSAAAQHSSSSSSSLQPTVLETSSLKREIQLIDEKWRKYLESTSSAANQQHFLSNDLASKISFFQNIGTQKIELDRGGGSSPTPGGGGGAAAATTTTTNASTKSGAGASETSRFYTAKIINGAWEKSPAYQKLTYEAGQKLLDQKWNQYIGYLSQSAAATSSSASTINNVRLSKTLNALASATAAAKKPSVVLQSQSATQHHTPPPSSSSSLSLSNGAAGFVTAYATSITLPAATQTRLNQHREWIRKFKADVDLNNNTLNNKI